MPEATFLLRDAVVPQDRLNCFGVGDRRCRPQVPTFMTFSQTALRPSLRRTAAHPETACPDARIAALTPDRF